MLTNLPWWVYCVIPAALWATGNLVDQHLARKYFADNALSLLATTGVFGFFSGLIILSFSDSLFTFSAYEISISVGLGALLYLAFLPYFKALQISEARVLVPLFQLSPVFTLIIAWVFLDETLSSLQITAIFIIIISSIGLVYDFKTFSLNLRTLILMIISCIGVAIFTVCSRYYVQNIDWLTFAGLVMMGSALCSVIMFIYSNKALYHAVSVLKNSPRNLIILFILVEFFSRFAMLFFQKSMTIAPAAAIAQAMVSGLQPFFIFIATIFFALLTPTTVAKITLDKTFALQIASVCFMTFGLYLLLVK